MPKSYFLNLMFNNARLGRLQHLGMFSLLLSVIAISIFAGILGEQAHAFFIIPFIIPVICFAVVATAVIKVKRLHDFNFSGWFLLLGLIPGIGSFWVLLIFMVPGSKSDNQYGKLPLPARKSDFWRILSFPIIFLIGFCLTHISI